MCWPLAGAAQTSAPQPLRTRPLRNQQRLREVKPPASGPTENREQHFHPDLRLEPTSFPSVSCNILEEGTIPFLLSAVELAQFPA